MCQVLGYFGAMPYRLVMIENCTRCGTPATSVMSYNYGDSCVWLDDLTKPVTPGAGYPICARHADRMTPPLGWTLTDRRRTVRLFAPPEATSVDVA